MNCRNPFFLFFSLFLVSVLCAGTTKIALDKEYSFVVEGGIAAAFTLFLGQTDEHLVKNYLIFDVIPESLTPPAFSIYTVPHQSRSLEPTNLRVRHAWELFICHPEDADPHRPQHLHQ